MIATFANYGSGFYYSLCMFICKVQFEEHAEPFKRNRTYLMHRMVILHEFELKRSSWRFIVHNDYKFICISEGRFSTQQTGCTLNKSCGSLTRLAASSITFFCSFSCCMKKFRIHTSLPSLTKNICHLWSSSCALPSHPTIDSYLNVHSLHIQGTFSLQFSLSYSTPTHNSLTEVRRALRLRLSPERVQQIARKSY